MTRYQPVMLKNRTQLGIPPILVPLAPVFGWIVGSALALVGVSYLARKEAEKLKESTGLNLSNIPKAVLAGSAGAIGVVVGGGLDGFGKVIATSLGIAGIGGAVYLMFSGQPKPPENASETPPKPVSLAPASPPVGEEAPAWQYDIMRAFTLSLPETQPNTGGRVRNAFMDQEYELLVRNESNKPQSFYAGASIYDATRGVVFTSSKITPPYNRVYVSLGPKGSNSDSASVKVLTPSSAQTLGRDVGVSVELFRMRDEKEPFLVSNAIPISYGYVG